MAKAAALYEEFSGHEADEIEEVSVDWPTTGLKVGKVDGILYETTRDGERENYIHRFKKTARPDFTVSHDGKHIALIGGKFAFTDRGIVDD